MAELLRSVIWGPDRAQKWRILRANSRDLTENFGHARKKSAQKRAQKISEPVLVSLMGVEACAETEQIGRTILGIRETQNARAKFSADRQNFRERTKKFGRSKNFLQKSAFLRKKISKSAKSARGILRNGRGNVKICKIDQK